MIVVDQIGTLGEIGTDGGANAVGKERIVSAAGRERPLGHHDDDHLFEFDAQAERHRTDEHPMAEGAVAAEVVGQLELEGPAKGSRGRIGVDTVEIAESVDRCIDALCSGLLFERPVGSQALAAEIRANQ